MSLRKKSLINIDEIPTAQCYQLFSRAQLFKREFEGHQTLDHLWLGKATRHEVMALLFFEPSTRTRVSFELAGHRLGVKSVTLGPDSSSIAKGESIYDTIETVAAMSPDVLVVRYNGDPEVTQLLQDLPLSVINAGSGVDSHPTQSLLDAFTMKESLGEIEGKKVLMIGDVVHSRVANSNLNLLGRLGCEIAICGPEELLPNTGPWASVKRFESLDDGMKWCDACICLRLQKERHGGKSLGLSPRAYQERFLVDARRMGILKPEAVLMHPGPVIRGEDIASEALEDPRCRVVTQVTNGVFVRAALLSLILGIEV